MPDDVDVLRFLRFGMMATIGDDEQVPLLLYDLNCGTVVGKAREIVIYNLMYTIVGASPTANSCPPTCVGGLIKDGR